VSREHGFFVDTETAVWQATTLQNGRRVTESAFVAGVLDADAPRHDVAATREVYRQLGVERAVPRTANGFLACPLLVPKHLMPNGVVDLVKLYDESIGEGIFFGQHGERQDYVAYRERCAEKSARLAETSLAATDELIAMAGWLETPEAACDALAEIAKKHAVLRTIEDKALDPQVFGTEAAGYIEQARHKQASGDHGGLDGLIRKAISTAEASMCGMLVNPAPSGANGQSTPETADQPTGKIRCINCREQVKASEVIKTASWRCPSCKYEVDVCTGKVLHHGEVPKKPSRPDLARAILELFKTPKLPAEAKL
jgi:hypothetical protein